MRQALSESSIDRSLESCGYANQRPRLARRARSYRLSTESPPERDKADGTRDSSDRRLDTQNMDIRGGRVRACASGDRILCGWVQFHRFLDEPDPKPVFPPVGQLYGR